MLSMKRIFDLLFLFIFSSLILLLVIIFYFTGLVFQGRPVFFTQARGGYKNKKIKIYKFRTMNISKNKYNKSVTFYGKFLRKFKIDELPQFYNILKGDLSIVGPRPLHYEYKKLYSKRQKQRFKVMPGITGYSQICTNNSDTWKKRFDLDIWYVQNRSIWLDFEIIFLTLKKIIVSIFLVKKDIELSKKFNGKN